MALTSLEKQINYLVYEVEDKEKQKNWIISLIQQEISEMQEILKNEEFIYGNYTDEIDEFIEEYKINII